MTTNQTIDGVLVPRELAKRLAVPMLRTPEYLFDHRDALDELRALLDAADHVHEWDINSEGTATVCHCGARSSDEPAEQPASVAAVPDGYCIMPRQLTAENGAKALLLGEFKLLVTKECPECCELEEPVEGCSICDGEGEYGQKHTIPWDQIKFIYSKAVSGLAMKAESAKT